MPYLVQNRDHMGRIEEEIFWEKIAPTAEDQGLQDSWPCGRTAFDTSPTTSGPVNVPADLDGLKLRTPKGAWRVKMFKSYGANPTPMSFSEVFTALQTGVIDGQENPFAQIYSAKFQEVQKYLSLTGTCIPRPTWWSARMKWESLPRTSASDPGETAKETQAYVYETAAQLETDLTAAS